MKTRFYAFLLCLSAWSSVSFAQPILTAAGINHQLGESLTSYFGAYQSPGNSGANQNWDFTALAGNQGTPFSVVAPASAPKGSYFPNATLAIVSDTTTARFYALTSSAFTNYGTYAGHVIIPFTDPEDFLRFPFTQGNTYTDTWSGEYTTSYLIYRAGTTTVTADAYGTMVTPAGTFPNAVRVHLVQSYQDSTNLFGNVLLVNYSNDQYMWFQNGFHGPIATTFTLTSSSGLNSSGASYYSSGPVNIAEPSALVGTVSLFPNPAADEVTLDMDLARPGAVDVAVLNALGQQVGAVETRSCGLGTNQFQLAVAGLPEGMYFAHVYVDGKAAITRQFVVAR